MGPSRFVAALFASIFVLSVSAIIPCASQGNPAQTDGPGGIVAVGGVTILTIRLPTAGMTVDQRADAVMARLRRILADTTLKPSDVVAAPLGKNYAEILVKDRLLVTVEPDTAKLSYTTPIKLAQLWAQHLRKVLPQVNARPNPNINEKKVK